MAAVAEPQATDWPSLPLAAWADTCATLHLWTQVVGKIRLAHAPLINHWWQVPLYVTSRGLTTSPIPYGARSFQIDFDFIDHRLVILTSDGGSGDDAAGGAQRCGLLCRGHGPAARAWAGDADLDHAGRNPRRHPVRAGPGPRILRSGLRAPVLAHPGARGSGLHAVPVASSSARRARCISSGAASTWLSRASPAARRRR